MGVFAALDVSQEETAVCAVDADGMIMAEGKVPTCPDAIAAWLAQWPGVIERVGMETGPLAVWLWNALSAKGVPIVCLDARHAHGVLKMMPNKTDRQDARGLAQIVRTGWFKEVQIKSHGAYVVRALLSARATLVSIRVRLENEMRGLLKTFGVMLGTSASAASRGAPRRSSRGSSRSRPSCVRSSKRWWRRVVPSSSGSERSTPGCAPPPAGATSCGCS